jgi:hypothetical protein
MPTINRYIRRLLHWIVDVTILPPLQLIVRVIDRIVRRCMPYVWGFGALYLVFTTDVLQPALAEVGPHLQAIVGPLMVMVILWQVYKMLFRKAFGGKKKK